MFYSELIKNTRDIDNKKGIVSFYFANFNSVDVYGRRMGSNSFNRTIKNNKDKILHFLQHNPEKIIGKPIEISTDNNGAFMVSKLSNTQLGRDTLILYEEGIYNQHSFGFIINKSHKEGEVEVVDELKMFEASTVAFGANENTPTISVNQLDDLLRYSKMSDEILEKLDKILVALSPAGKHTNSQKDLYQEFIKAINSYKNN